MSNSDDLTPLHISGGYGNVEATKAFVERTAGLDSTNKDDFTPLYSAAVNGKIDVFRYLTEIGFIINICDVQVTLLFYLLIFRLVWKLSRFY